MQVLQANATYDVEAIDPGVPAEIEGVNVNFGRMLNYLAAVNKVLQADHGFSTNSKNWLMPNMPWMSGAIQLGLWESVFEKDIDLSITGGGNEGQWFWAGDNTANENRNVDPLGDIFLQSVFDLVNDDANPIAPLSASEVLWAKNASGQDVLIDSVDVPLPATGLLLIGGLGVFAWRRRKVVSSVAR